MNDIDRAILNVTTAVELRHITAMQGMERIKALLATKDQETSNQQVRLEDENAMLKAADQDLREQLVKASAMHVVPLEDPSERKPYEAKLRKP